MFFVRVIFVFCNLYYIKNLLTVAEVTKIQQYLPGITRLLVLTLSFDLSS